MDGREVWIKFDHALVLLIIASSFWPAISYAQPRSVLMLRDSGSRICTRFSSAMAFSWFPSSAKYRLPYQWWAKT